MKKLLLISVLGFSSISSNTFASQFCDMIERISYQTMLSRQQGVPLSKEMGIINEIAKTESKGSKAPQILKKIVISAYEEPKYDIKENQEREAQEFSNDWTLACYKLEDNYK